jgi:hypothetical protein
MQSIAKIQPIDHSTCYQLEINAIRYSDSANGLEYDLNRPARSVDQAGYVRLAVGLTKQASSKQT